MKFQNICPRNCYDTCSIVSTTRNGVLVSVEGNAHHEYTLGKLCPKALDDVKKVYSQINTLETWVFYIMLWSPIKPVIW